MFSIVIPAYKASDTIERCLDSVCKQNLGLIGQIIIVDDYSPDFRQLASIVARYQLLLPISLLRNECNKNGSYSRNVGVQAATSKFVAFLDADDCWEPNHLIKYKTFIERNNLKVAALYSPFILMGSNERIIDVRPKRAMVKNELVSEYVFLHNQQMQTSTFVIDANSAKRFLFDHKLTRHQDSDFMMRLQYAGVPIYFLNDASSRYYFSRGDLRKRVQSGRINHRWCDEYLLVKNDFFSDSSKAGYLFNVKLRIVILERKWLLIPNVILDIVRLSGVFKFIKMVFRKLR